MKTIDITTFKKILDLEQNNDTIDFINVCTPVEYAEKHIKGVRSVPLDTLPSEVEKLKNKKTIFVHCRSGKRGAQAIETLTKLGVRSELINVEGGLMAWEESRHPTAFLAYRKGLSLMRQVFLVAGMIILLGHILSWVTGQNSYLLLPIFVGFGLSVSGLTGWCGLQLLLAKMPWNKV